jgi:iron complex outermembrane receptor protein
MHYKMQLRRTAIASAISVVFGAQVMAQTQQESTQQETAQKATPKDDTPVVTVTAQGRRESLRKVPYNISALNGQDLEDRKITDQTEMLRSVAGASIVDRGNRNSGVINSVTIRGLNTNGSALGDFQTSAVPTVSTYINQTPIFANFLIKDVERVEVLRGPQGTLYGSGSLGGTVRYITRQPELHSMSGKVETGVSRTTGSDGHNYNVDGVLNLPIGEVAAMRVAVGRVDNAGIVDLPNVYVLDAKGAPVAPNGVTNPATTYRYVKDADTVKINYGRVSVLVQPSDAFHAVLTYQQQSDHVGGRRQPTIGDNGYGQPYRQYQNGSVQLEPSQRDVRLAALELEFDLGFATLTSGTSHYDHDGTSLSENTGFYAQNKWLADYYYNYPRPMAQAFRAYNDKALVQELRLISKNNERFSYIVGAYFQDQDLGATQLSYLHGLKAWADVALPRAGVTSDNDFMFQRAQNFRERAAYGELTWKFSPVFRMTGGLRHFKTTFNNDSTLGSGVIAPDNTPTRTVFEQSDSGTLFKANASWDVTPNIMVYGTLSQGYRRAGANSVPLTGNFAEDKAWLTYRPDRNLNRELGIKGVSGSLRYNISVFDITWKDIQIDTTTPVWGFYVAQNGGRASSRGLEAELSGKLGSSWRYNVSYAYVDAKLDEDARRPDEPTLVTARAGTVLPGTAKNTFSASLDHVSTTDNGWYWTNRVNLYHQGSTENSISDSPKVKATWAGFTQIGASSTLAIDNWSATLFVKNLTNNASVTGGFPNTAMGTSPAQNYYGNGSKVLISQPRTIGLSARYTF